MQIPLIGSSEAINAIKFIVQRQGTVISDGVTLKKFYNVGDVPYTPGKDAIFTDNHVEDDRRYFYRYKAVYKARDSEWVYVTHRTPPTPTPVGMCVPDSPTWFTYTVTHPVVDLTGYYKVYHPGIAYNSDNQSICFVYAENINMWLLVRLGEDLTVSDIQSATTTSICKRPGVYYYASSSSSEWIPKHSRYWLANRYYKNVKNIVTVKPNIECWRELTDIDYGITPQPTLAPRDEPLPDNPVTPVPTPTTSAVPTPTPSPTQLVILRNRLLHESGQPLLAEDGSYFLPES